MYGYSWYIYLTPVKEATGFTLRISGLFYVHPLPGTKSTLRHSLNKESSSSIHIFFC